MFCAAVSFAQTAKLSGGNFYSAESILEVYRLAKGEDCKLVGLAAAHSSATAHMRIETLMKTSELRSIIY